MTEKRIAKTPIERANERKAKEAEALQAMVRVLSPKPKEREE
jgi:hypothetical protein